MDKPEFPAVTPASELSVWDAAAVFLRHKRKMAACFVCVFAAAVFYTVSAPETYRSEAKLMVRLGRENIGLDPTATMGDLRTVNVMQTREEEINSVATLLSNRSLAEHVVNEIGSQWILDEQGPPLAASRLVSAPAKPPGAASASRRFVSELIPSTRLSDHDKAIRKLQQGLEVEAVSETNLVQISYESRDAELSRAVVRELIETYLTEHVQIHRTPGTREFLSRQTSEVQTQLEQAEEKLRSTRESTGLIAPVEQRAALVERIATLQTKHVDALAQTAELSAEVERLQVALERMSRTHITEETSGAANHASDDMRAQLYALQLQQQELMATHTDDHPNVKQIKSQIEAAKNILAEEAGDRTEITMGPNQVYLQTEMELIRKEPTLASLQARTAMLEKHLNEAQQQLRELNTNEILIASLQRELDIQDAKYRKYAADAEQARIDTQLEAAKISNIALAQPATLEPYPASPRVKLNLVLGFIAAIFASGSLALLCESYGRWKERRFAMISC